MSYHPKLNVDWCAAARRLRPCARPGGPLPIHPRHVLGTGHAPPPASYWATRPAEGSASVEPAAPRPELVDTRPRGAAPPAAPPTTWQTGRSAPHWVGPAVGSAAPRRCPCRAMPPPPPLLAGLTRPATAAAPRRRRGVPTAWSASTAVRWRSSCWAGRAARRGPTVRRSAAPSGRPNHARPRPSQPAARRPPPRGGAGEVCGHRPTQGAGAPAGRTHSPSNCGATLRGMIAHGAARAWRTKCCRCSARESRARAARVTPTAFPRHEARGGTGPCGRLLGRQGQTLDPRQQAAELGPPLLRSPPVSSWGLVDGGRRRWPITAARNRSTGTRMSWPLQSRAWS